MKKICHITTVHPRNEPRIFSKECKTLYEDGNEINLIVSDGKGDEIKEGIHIYDIGKAKNKFQRFLKFIKKAYQKAISLNCEVYHFHDPELIPIALKLKKGGKKVIYDVHEDLPRQIYYKYYIPKIFRKFLSFIIEKYENYAAKKFNYIVTATPFIRDRFLKINTKTIDIRNMPILSEFTGIEHNWENKEKAFCYVGGVTRIRGINEVIESLKYFNDILLYIAGPIEDNELQKMISNETKIKYLGFLNRDELKTVFKKSIGGFVTFLPFENHIKAQPNKLFEYMSAGIPVIASNFPLWKEIIEGSNCGICVNPLNPSEIASAIDYIINHPKEAEIMGENGRKAILEKYNWEMESKKLLNIYKSII